jgi:hypothetical protein
MKKKILITGMNAEQCKKDYFLKKELAILSSHYSIVRCLEDLGYEVDQRPVSLGEDLSRYDDVIVYIHSIQSFCQRLWGGLYAIAARPNCIIAFDDWQVDQVYRSFKPYLMQLLNEEEKAFREYLVDLYQGKEDLQTIKNYKSMYIEACSIILGRNNRLAICGFKGGDLTKFDLNWNPEKIFRYNPNPYNLNRRPDNNYGVESIGLNSFFDEVNDVPYDQKSRSWVFSSLIQNKTQKWINTQNIDNWKWPILNYGARRGKFKSLRVKEPDMCRVYNANWGCVLPGYYHAGSGWWRSRVLQTIDAKSILLCEDAEGSIFGEAFVGLKAQDIEDMDLAQLINLAENQYSCLYDNHPLDKSIERSEILTILESK